MAAWIRIALGDAAQCRTTFSCQSFDQQGTQLTTGPIADRDWIPELTPPQHDIQRLPEHTSYRDAIETHMSRVAGRDDLMQWNPQTIEGQVLANSQSLVDFMVRQRYWIPISDNEYHELSALSDYIIADVTSRL